MAPTSKPRNDEHAQNLTRIRTNQRRSRARRAAYLSDLETRYQRCEQTGVQANKEIQQAARKVVEENRRLKGMLRARGVGEGEIEGVGGEGMGVGGRLEGLLGGSWRCGEGQGGGEEADGRGMDDMGSGVAEETAEGMAQALPQLLPRVDGSSTAAASSSTPSASPRGSEMQARAAYPVPTARQLAPSSAPPLGSPTPWDDPSFFDAQTAQPFADESSCHIAADTIRSFKPNLGNELELELGCGDGVECHVANSKIFSIMDKYSEGA